MSFQLSTATALPAEVQLGREKPQGAFCLRSRYSLSANSASSWNAGTTLSIPLQTGTPGTFTDVKQGIIQATMQISNSNPYVDYLNFGPSGAIILFDEMRIYSSGTPIEENLRYSETADLLTIQVRAAPLRPAFANATFIYRVVINAGLSTSTDAITGVPTTAMPATHT